MKLSIIILFLAVAFNVEAQKSAVANDSSLTKLKASLPPGWQLKMAANWLVIQSKDSAWKINRQNAHVGSGKLTAEDFRHQGNLQPLSFMFRYEPRWSSEKIAQTKTTNDTLQSQIQGLKSKYHLEEVFNRNPGLTSDYKLKGENPDEDSRIEAYKKEMQSLKSKVVEVPVFNTETLSLFNTSFNEVYDEYYYPTKAGDEMLKVHAAISGSLQSAR